MNISPQGSPCRITTYLVCSLENEQQFIDNRQLLVLLLQFWLKLLDLSSQATQNKGKKSISENCTGTHHPQESFTSESNNKENPISQMLPYYLCKCVCRTWELVHPIHSTRTADTVRLLTVLTALGISEDSKVHLTAYFANCIKLYSAGVKTKFLPMAEDEFTNSSVRFNYPFHYLNLHSSEHAPPVNQRNSQ